MSAADEIRSKSEGDFRAAAVKVARETIRAAWDELTRIAQAHRYDYDKCAGELDEDLTTVEDLVILLRETVLELPKRAPAREDSGEVLVSPEADPVLETALAGGRAVLAAVTGGKS
jgi:hypothetical protein